MQPLNRITVDIAIAIGEKVLGGEELLCRLVSQQQHCSDFKKIKSSRWNNLRCPPKHSLPLLLKPSTQTNIKIEFYALDLPLEREIYNPFKHKLLLPHPSQPSTTTYSVPSTLNHCINSNNKYTPLPRSHLDA